MYSTTPSPLFQCVPVRKAILPNPWVPFDERTLSIPDGTPLRKSCHGSLSKCSPSSNGTKPKVYFQREQSEPEVFCGNRPRGVTVSTLDSESSDRGSNPREVSRQILKTELKKRMQHCTRQHHRLCFNASLCEKLSFPTHGYRMLRGRSRYQMAQLSESPNHPMRCVRDVTVHGSSQNVRALLMAPNPKCTSKGSNLNQKFSVAIDLVV